MEVVTVGSHRLAQNATYHLREVVVTDASEPQITESVRDVLSKHARLVVDAADIKDDDDLFRLGMTSHAAVSVMLGLEDAFGVEFPESMLRRGTFGSVNSIRVAITELLSTPAGD